MKAETRTVQEVLHGDRRFLIPVYQRPYVWTQDRQWEPLWQDVEATVVRLAEARGDGHAKGLDPAQADTTAAPHFLGAVVIEQALTATGDVDTRMVVDGQQRLTTLQLLLRGVLDALDEADAPPPLRAKIRKSLRNDPDVVSPGLLNKVEPRPADADAFAAAMGTPAPAESDSSFAAARAYFAACATGFLGSSALPLDPYSDAGETEQHAAFLVAALLGLVKLVVIDLEPVDDAQVIFEALNARNTPLSATDLVKNLLFMRAQAMHADPQHLYDTLWKRFDDESDWWTVEVGVGHAQRPRQDWLLGDWLIAQRARPISVGRLYGEFRRWLDESGTKPIDALETLNSYADAYESLHGRRAGASPAERLAFQRTDVLNITAAVPLLLWLLAQPADLLPPAERELTFRAVESYLVRRMATKYQTRAYGQVFVDVLRAARAAPANPGFAAIDALRGGPQSYDWPTDEDVALAFSESRYYGPGGINQERLRLLLGAVDAYLQSKAVMAEPISIHYTGLTVEHVIPQTWRTHWPVVAGDPTERLLAEAERDRHVHRIGNLTLTTAPLNSSLGHHPWEAKKAQLSAHSHLRLNAMLVQHDEWDEGAIDARSLWLAEQVCAVWPGPAATMWNRSTA